MRRVSRFMALLASLAVPAMPAAATDKPIAVEIVEVHAQTLKREYSLTGELRARDSVRASFPITGRVVEVLVEEGQHVNRGELLARIDSVQQQQALRAAEAGLDTAISDERQAAEDLARAEALLARGATTRAARDAADDALQVAAGALAQARAEFDRATRALSDTELRAAQDATVTQRLAEAGQVVRAAQPVLELALSNGIEAVFDVPEVNLTRGYGQTRIRLVRFSDPTAEFYGTVTEVAPLVDATTGTVEVTVAVTDPPPGVAFGEAVRGTATVEEPGKIVLPYTVLSVVGDDPAVWRVDPASQTVALTPIEVERYKTGLIVVAGGVEEGDKVVARGAQLLFPGRRVKPAEAGK